ncbi:hypothetical protein THAOC_33046, partial [Thalassiosira oceanica]
MVNGPLWSNHASRTVGRYSSTSVQHLKSLRLLVLTQSSADPRCPSRTHTPRAKLVSEEGDSTFLRRIPGRDIAGDPSLDPPRSSGDTGSVWIGSSVEEQGPPAPRLASAAGGTPITAPH